MIGGELLVCVASFMSVFRSCPKKGKRSQKRRKRIARKGRFKLYDNPTKQYRLEPTENIRSKAQKCRAEQLAHNWPAEAALADMLTQIGVQFERQAVIYRTGSYICVDILVRDRSVAFELDGSAHELQKGYDAGRDRWLEQTHGIRTVRLANRTVLHDRAHTEAVVRRALGVWR
jgi:very-short-patch-repair endonuclease